MSRYPLCSFGVLLFGRAPTYIQYLDFYNNSRKYDTFALLGLASLWIQPLQTQERLVRTYHGKIHNMNYRISSIKQRNPSLLTPGTNVVWIFTHAKISHQNLWASPCCFPESNHRQTPRLGISSTGGGPTHTFPKKTPWTSALCLVSTPAFQNIKTQTPKLGSSTKKQLEGKKNHRFSQLGTFKPRRFKSPFQKRL